MAVSCIISEIKRDRPIGRNSRFFIPLYIRRNIVILFGVEKLDGEKSLMIYLTVSTQYRRVTDRQTDGPLATA